jgi:predicted metal-dependent phosphoesterase TrpH
VIRVDCHLHTALSGDAVTTIDELTERVEQERLDVVCITDHNVTAAAVAALERGI